MPFINSLAVTLPSAEITREDWDYPLGIAYGIKSVVTEDSGVFWRRVFLDKVELSRQSSLLLLQGLGVRDLFIPNARLAIPDHDLLCYFHLLIGCRRWAPNGTPPCLAGLSLVGLVGAPTSMGSDSILEIIMRNNSFEVSGGLNG